MGPYGEVLATLQSPKNHIVDPIVSDSMAVLRSVHFAEETA